MLLFSIFIPGTPWRRLLSIHCLQWWKCLRSVKLLPLKWGVPFYKERGGPPSLTYSSLRFKHHLPSSGPALPNVWDSPWPLLTGRLVWKMASGASPFFPFLYYLSYSARYFVIVSLCHFQRLFWFLFPFQLPKEIRTEIIPPSYYFLFWRGR